MLGPLYKVLPRSFHKLLTVEVRAFRRARDERIEREFPHVELAPEHVANLRVMIDRRALLESLPKQAIVAEIGVARGDFSELILDVAKPKQLHLIDWWTRPREYRGLRAVVEERFASQIADGQVIIHQGLSTNELKSFEDHFFDWVYVDTGHDYATTKAELEICHQKVKAGGIIAGHDYVTGSWDLDIRYGVIEAVNGFCVHHNWEMVYLTHERSRNLSFALREMAR
jgi:predicted O-methyltransferase YrrM